jgi:uncharacterized protein YebE (UPF0316 family)
MEPWILAFLVFLARMVQNTVGTVRDIMVIRGDRGKAALLSFAETMIWLIVFCAVLQNFFAQPLGWVTAINFLAFAGGYAVGSYAGILVEEKMALGHVAIAVVPSERDEKVGEELKRTGFPLTIFPCQGERGPHHMYLSVVSRRQLSVSLKRIQEIAPHAFVTVIDTRMAKSWVFGRQRA